MPKLCLIDASGYIHRAYHAIPLLTTSKGEPVNAVYGFSRMLSKVLKEEKPDFMGVCFDTPAPTFRHVEYVEYKANRQESEPTLISQLPLSEDLARLWGLPCLKMDGYEADDLIATLARFGRDKGWAVVILSSDKDILQLVEEGVSVRDEMKKVSYDALKVKERYGVAPDQLIDLFCLIGDKVDNVPGVPGIGEKTASKLLATYGSLENIFSDSNGHSASLYEKLNAYKEHVFKNRSLIRLKNDVPLEIKLDSLKIKNPDSIQFPAFLRRMEFKGEVFGVEVITDPDIKANTTREVKVALTENDARQLEEVLKKTKRLAYDIETDGLDKFHCNVVGFSLSVEINKAWYIPVGHHYIGVPTQLSLDRVRRLLAPVLENPSVLKIAQNLKFDNTLLARIGIIPQGLLFDTMVAAYCLDPSRNSYGLKDLAALYLKERMVRFTELFGKGQDHRIDEIPIEKAATYAAADAEVTLRLADLFERKLKEEKLDGLFSDLEMPLVQIIQDMESAGIAIDADHLTKVGEKFKTMRGAIEKEIFALAGEEFVLNSPKQLSRILFEKLKLPPVKKTKTGYSTDEEVLLKLAVNHPICEKIISCRELSKLISTYIESLVSLVNKDSGRIHTTFHQTGTITGRLSSSDPNLQNIPIRTENGREIRKAFVPSKGNVLMSADYSQIDLRALAHMSEDPALIRAFREGGDVHVATAAEIFHVLPAEVTSEMRRSAKAINFGIVYGQQAFALSQSLGIEIEKGREFISKYFERYAGVRAWIETTLAEARKTGYVATLAGRRRNVADINSLNAFVRGFAERVAINTPIQGSSADIIKYAMIRVSRMLKEAALATKMVLQVHDELVFDVPESEIGAVIDLVRQGMEQAFELRVPLVVDIKVGKNWNDMEKVKIKTA